MTVCADDRADRIMVAGFPMELEALAFSHDDPYGRPEWPQLTNNFSGSYAREARRVYQERKEANRCKRSELSKQRREDALMFVVRREETTPITDSCCG